MSTIPAKRIYVQDDRGADTDTLIATIHPASPESVATVLAADPNADDGYARSPFMWVRLQNGDLILGCFPQDDTYFLCEKDAETPRNLVQRHCAHCYRPIPGED